MGTGLVGLEKTLTYMCCLIYILVRAVCFCQLNNEPYLYDHSTVGNIEKNIHAHTQRYIAIVAGFRYIKTSRDHFSLFYDSRDKVLYYAENVLSKYLDICSYSVGDLVYY